MNMGYAGKLKVLKPISTITSSEEITIKVEIFNDSADEWASDGINPCNLSYHWSKKSGEMHIFDGLRTKLIKSIFPGQSLITEIKVAAPQKAGIYFIVLTLVKEGVAWFENKGFKTVKIRIKVNPPWVKNIKPKQLK
ncbi:hypothetical protein [Crenothrix polyspora]|uniref:Uncharacterized protein n=1 Tax=Crenothrix polyspora TaxID=360316 RepID=A0A1R4GYE0_9GAMM|nr:hypothetical protein [Crenothrix polyspora]SJM88975.1 hypothetical protein CRENPOLYSF1_10010 [Crenothrix polyspora]